MTLAGVGIEGLAGALIGGAITYFIHWRSERRRERNEHKVAAMRIATGLRAWLTSSEELVEEITLYESTNGQAGALRTDLPGFSFEATLDLLSQLRPDQATKLFTLMHAKQSLRNGIAFALERGDIEQATETLCKGLGKLYLDALPIYEALVQQAGWPGMSLPAGGLSLMRRQIERGELPAPEDDDLDDEAGQKAES